MPPVVRSILAVLAGVVAGVIVVVIFDAIVSRLYPLPLGTNMRDPESVRAALSGFPTAAFLILLAGWTLATGAAAFTAGRLAGRSPLLHGLIAAGIQLAATLANLFALPHPVWMWPAVLVLLPLAAWIATRAVAPPRAAG